jgi:hypothetical protein
MCGVAERKINAEENLKSIATKETEKCLETVG